jgi:exopolysaccharide biosynthesis polyprenyl glycosylphosphotransferase
VLFHRRNTGIANLHRLLVGLEAVLLWVVLSKSGLSFTTLLPPIVYPIAILLGALIAPLQIVFPKKAFFGSELHRSYVDAGGAAIRQLSFICGTVFCVVVLLKDPGMSRFFLLSYLSCLLPLLTGLNRFQPEWLSRHFQTAENSITMLIVGNPSAFPDLENWLAVNRKLGFKPIGHVTCRPEDVPIPSLPQLGGLEDIPDILRKSPVKQLVVLEPPENAEDTATLLSHCLANGTRLLIHNHFVSKSGYPFQTFQDEKHSFLTLQDEPFEDPVNRILKRGLDILVAMSVLATVFPPLVAIVAIVQRRQSPGPLFHRQLRTGLNQAPFTILKFRTMHHVEEDDLQPPFGLDTDRIYPFGHFLRRSSLDEIPQFINVLKGEMSTVGPRPHLLNHSKEILRNLDIYLLRYFTKPGITGLAQCSGFRGVISDQVNLSRRIELDLEYIRNWSIWMDFWIILKTTRQIVFPPNTAK